MIRHQVSDVKKKGGRVVVHQHCHAKVLSSQTALRKMLEQWGFEVEMLDAGCCGMAGSFGYESDKFILSMQIGKQRLFPSIKKEPNESNICAPGFSCRHQIMDGTGRQALHPAQLIAQTI